MGERAYLRLIGDDEAVVSSPPGQSAARRASTYGRVDVEVQRMAATLRACSTAIETAGSPTGIFDQILRVAIPTVADWGAVYARSSASATWFALTLTYPFSRGALQNLLDLDSVATRDALGVRQATDCGCTQRRSIAAHFPAGQDRLLDPARRAALAATRPVDAVSVPLRIGVSTMAVILLVRTRDSFRSDDLTIVSGLRTIVDRTLTRLATASGMQAWTTVTRCH